MTVYPTLLTEKASFTKGTNTPKSHKELCSKNFFPFISAAVVSFVAYEINNNFSHTKKA